MATPLEALNPAKMTDGGMYAWAAILMLASLAASYVIAAWWQRRRDKRQA